MISTISHTPTRPATSKVDLPRDEGAHEGEKIEWWYMNGHLRDEQGREYGFHNALFDVPDVVDARYNRDLPLMPGATVLDTAFTQETERRHSDFRTPQFHRSGDWPHEGLTPGALDQQFDDKRGMWKVERIDDETIHLTGPHGDAKLDLTMKQSKPALMMGGDGEIPMGPFGSSKYYSLSRLETTGTVEIDGEVRTVEGTAWMDHQWGDMMMFNGYDGWDWFGIQLDSGADINAFRFRGPGGTNVQASVGISASEGTQAVSDEMQLTPRAWWTSPHTGIRYPTAWHLTVPDRQIELDLAPTFDDQEMRGTPPFGKPRFAPIPTYWEGSMTVVGTVGGKPVTGKAYGEFTGYGKGDELRPRP